MTPPNKVTESVGLKTSHDQIKIMVGSSPQSVDGQQFENLVLHVVARMIPNRKLNRGFESHSQHLQSMPMGEG